MIILVTGMFDIYDKYGKTGRKEFVASHGVREETGEIIIVSQDHPVKLGAEYNEHIGEWVIYE